MSHPYVRVACLFVLLMAGEAHAQRNNSAPVYRPPPPPPPPAANQNYNSSRSSGYGGYGGSGSMSSGGGYRAPATISGSSGTYRPGAIANGGMGSSNRIGSAPAAGRIGSSSSIGTSGSTASRIGNATRSGAGTSLFGATKAPANSNNRIATNDNRTTPKGSLSGAFNKSSGANRGALSKAFNQAGGGTSGGGGDGKPPSNTPSVFRKGTVLTMKDPPAPPKPLPRSQDQGNRTPAAVMAGRTVGENAGKNDKKPPPSKDFCSNSANRYTPTCSFWCAAHPGQCPDDKPPGGGTARQDQPAQELRLPGPRFAPGGF